MKLTAITLTLVALVAGASAASCPSLFPHDTVWGEWNLCCDYIGPNDVSIFLSDVYTGQMIRWVYYMLNHARRLPTIAVTKMAITPGVARLDAKFL